MVLYLLVSSIFVGFCSNKLGPCWNYLGFDLNIRLIYWNKASEQDQRFYRCEYYLVGFWCCLIFHYKSLKRELIYLKFQILRFRLNNCLKYFSCYLFFSWINIFCLSLINWLFLKYYLDRRECWQISRFFLLNFIWVNSLIS